MRDIPREVSMRFLVKVRVDVGKIAEFGSALGQGLLDRSMIKSETYCLKEDPAVGYSVWEAADRAAFEERFSSWRPYYAAVEAREVVGPAEAMKLLAAPDH
jgi:hypothetical protein